MTRISKRILLLLLTLAAALPALSDRHEPQGFQGTVSRWNAATKTLTLLENSITIDASGAEFFDEISPEFNEQTNEAGGEPMVGSVVKVILKPGPYAPNQPLPAARVSFVTRTPLTMWGNITSVDVADNSFVVSGTKITATPETKWRAGAVDARSVADLRVNYAVTVEVTRGPQGATARQIFVVGNIPPLLQRINGFLIAMDGAHWTVRDLDARTHDFEVFDSTVYKSNVAGDTTPSVGDYVEVLAIPDSDDILLAYEVTIEEAPYWNAEYDYAVFGTLSALDAANGKLTLSEGGHTLQVKYDGSTRFIDGAQIGDYVEVRVRMVEGSDPIAVLVIKTVRTRVVNFQGTVEARRGNVWIIDDVTVTTDEKTLLINAPRVGDVVRVTGETDERGALRNVRALSIERL